MKIELHGTTILAVRKDNKVAICGDGQVTEGESVIAKSNTRKVRKIFSGKVAVGFAGSTADAFALMERFEDKLNEYNGDLVRAAVELAKLWRLDKQLRNLQALMLVTDGKDLLEITGLGDVIEPEGDVLAIGSGGNYARAAARAYLDADKSMPAEEIVKRSLNIAADICVFTNHNLVCEVIDGNNA